MRNVLSALLSILGGLFLGFCLCGVVALAKSGGTLAYALLGAVAIVGTLWPLFSRGDRS